MSKHETSLTTEQHDHRVRQAELISSYLLRIGVLVSFVVILFGTVVSFTHHTNYRHSHEQLQTLVSDKAEFPRTLTDIWQGLGAFQGRAIISLGLLILIATPVMRVGISIFTFGYEHDPIFVLISSVVLLMLLLSFLLGKVE